MEKYKSNQIIWNESCFQKRTTARKKYTKNGILCHIKIAPRAVAVVIFILPVISVGVIIFRCCFIVSMQIKCSSLVAAYSTIFRQSFMTRTWLHGKIIAVTKYISICCFKFLFVLLIKEEYIGSKMHFPTIRSTLQSQSLWKTNKELFTQCFSFIFAHSKYSILFSCKFYQKWLN